MVQGVGRGSPRVLEFWCRVLGTATLPEVGGKVRVGEQQHLLAVCALKLCLGFGVWGLGFRV